MTDNTKQDESFDEAPPRIDETPTESVGGIDEADEPGGHNADDAAATPAGVPHARPDENSAGAEDSLEGKGWAQGGHAVR